jgi:predicted MPP superfamily phosphohydrolase/uncharacterized membrane protein YhaH (DUF805 family)
MHAFGPPRGYAGRVPYWMHALLYSTVTIGGVGLLVGYVHRRTSRAFALGRRAQWILAALLVAGPAMLVASRRAEPWIGTSACGVLGVVGSIGALALLGAGVLLGAAQLAALARRWIVARRARDARAEPAAPTDEPLVVAPLELGRRELLQRVSVGVPVAAALGASGYGALFGRHEHVLEEVEVPIDGLPRALDGYRIVQLSDFHFGVFAGAPERRAAVELTRRARPDLVVLTGDLVDNHVAHAPEVGRLIRELVESSARDGVAVIGGNHDYYAGLDEVLRVARQAGARALRNDGVLIAEQNVALLGLDDLWGRRYGWGPGPDLSTALSTVPRDLPRIVLSHNPITFRDTAGSIALQLSGHTHGGQLTIGGYPAAAVWPYVRGLYREQGSYLYVNRGFGVGGPAALIGSAPEVTLLVLRA